MTDPFFPGPVFGWTFIATLFVLLAIAAYEDLKRLIIPKWLTLPLLGCGVVFNLVRAGLVAQSSSGVWDGFLFSLGGFATGFALFLAMWVLGTCGGGDVKLFAAVGAWVGWKLAFYVLCVTLVLVVVLSVVRVAFNVAASGRGNAPTGKRGKKRLIAFALPVALSTTLVLLWVCRVELGLGVKHGPSQGILTTTPSLARLMKQRSISSRVYNVSIVAKIME